MSQISDKINEAIARIRAMKDELEAHAAQLEALRDFLEGS